MDRLKKYFTGRLDDLVFIDLSEGFVKGAEATMALAGVPVPVSRENMEGLVGGREFKTIQLAENMTLVLGCDPEFKYKDEYLAFLKKAFSLRLIDIIMNRGAKAADDGDLYDACVHFRAALCLDENHPAAILAYARICQDIYTDSEDDEEIGSFKAESMEYFEKMTLVHPEVPAGHYYLGFAYINMGLYTKAKIAWEEFLEAGEKERGEAFSKSKEAEEIKGRLSELEAPVAIEEGCNHVIAGRYDAGLDILEQYKDSEYGKWWPLHYYLGMAYSEIGEIEMAIDSFKAVLKLNASHTDSMKELADLYHQIGDNEMEQKYRKKIMLVSNLQ